MITTGGTRLHRRHRWRRWAIAAVLVIVAGAFVGWEERDVRTVRDGRVIASHHGLVGPWVPCGVRAGRGPLVEFRVRQVFAYGWFTLEVEGSTTMEPAAGARSAGS